MNYRRLPICSVNFRGKVAEVCTYLPSIVPMVRATQYKHTTIGAILYASTDVPSNNGITQRSLDKLRTFLMAENREINIHVTVGDALFQSPRTFQLSN